jgi:hypothetical protein
MSVRIKDRKTEVEYLRMACNLAKLGIRYEHADLILRLQERLKKLKGKFSLSDGAEIHHKWKEDWSEYFEALEKKKLTSSL